MLYKNMQLRFDDFCKDKSNVHIADLVLGGQSYTEGHDHDFYEFFVVLEGEFEHMYNGERVILKAGMCQFLQPDTFHRFEKSQKGELRCLRNVALSSAFFDELKEPLRERLRGKLWQPTLLSQGVFEQFKYKSDQLLRHYTPEFAAYCVKSIVMDLLLQIAYQEIEEMRGPHWLVTLCDQLREPEYMMKGLPWVIEQSGKSQEHVVRTFKKYYGLTPTAYINELRLQMSAKLLTTTKEPIIEIAYRCGFNTVGYYNKRFKEKYGCTPTTYRIRHEKTFY